MACAAEVRFGLRIGESLIGGQAPNRLDEAALNRNEWPYGIRWGVSGIVPVAFQVWSFAGFPTDTSIVYPFSIMGLLSNLLGNASEVDIAKIQAELEPVLVPGETIGRGFKVFRDLFIFTDHRLILIDRQGITGSKVSYHSVLYRNITQFSVETAGSFDADSELKIWVSGGGLPITKEFKRGTDVVGIQKYLAYCVFGGSIEQR